MLCQLCHTPVNYSVCPKCKLKPTESPEVYPLHFGKFKGSTVEQVYSIQPSYLNWMVEHGVGSPAQRAQARLYLNRQVVTFHSGSQTTLVTQTDQNKGMSPGWAIAILVAVTLFFAYILTVNQKSEPIPTVNPPASAATVAPAQGEIPQQMSQEGQLMYEATGCDIKGNVGFNTGEKIYHVPGQQYYNSTVINTRYGERWFCTEQDAVNNGWRKSEL